MVDLLFGLWVRRDLRIQSCGLGWVGIGLGWDGLGWVGWASLLQDVRMNLEPNSTGGLIPSLCSGGSVETGWWIQYPVLEPPPRD